MNKREIRYRYVSLLAVMVVAILVASTASAQPCANIGGCWNGLLDGSKVWTMKTSAPPPQVGIGMVPDSALTIAGAEVFRYAPNATARLVDIDMNQLVGAVQARNGASMRIDLRWDLNVPAFMWMIRQAN